MDTMETNCYKDLEDNFQTPEDMSVSPLNEQMLKLKAITNQLKQALRGQDVEWWDPKDHSASLTIRDFLNDDHFGSGDGDDDDDEDMGSGEEYAFENENEGSGEDVYEGSGDCDECDEEKDWQVDWTTTSSTTTTTTVKPEDIQIIEDNEIDTEVDHTDKTSGSSGRRVYSWEVYWAVVMYWFPQIAHLLPSLVGLAKYEL